MKAEGELGLGARCGKENGRRFLTVVRLARQRLCRPCTALLIPESGYQDIIAVFEDIQLAFYDGGTYPNCEHVIWGTRAYKAIYMRSPDGTTHIMKGLTNN